MKKALTFGVIAAVAAIVFYAWQNLRGSGPAASAPATNISSLVGSAQTDALPIKLAAGYRISLFAKDLGKPRVLILDPDNRLLVSIPSEGRVVALPDRNNSGVAEKVVTVIEGLEGPHGIAFRCAPDCKVYVAEENQVAVYSYDRATMKAVKEKKLCDLPTGGSHVTRTLLFLPKPHDDILLISVGSSCNVCEERDVRRAKILSVPAEGGKPEVYASGLRNAVFMTLHPRTHAVWATEMGRDLLGDDIPPDEIDVIERGANYGWPFCYGKNVHDDGSIRACAIFAASRKPSRPTSIFRPIPRRSDSPSSLSADVLTNTRTIFWLPITGPGTGAFPRDTRSSACTWIRTENI